MQIMVIKRALSQFYIVN